ncbi:DUF882 domain-containing protein [Phreatobacter sp.]|uniref:DUF882 domain-containing protein n=1 Tax=Phreatobacter sp. TaxID=1966341 RepID=UPI002600B9F9|nr:DUF882 domain-containing protein [Phreatobacter sp.]
MRTVATVSLGFGFLLTISGTTQNVVANGDTRTLSMLHKHTGEQILITFKRNGRYDQDALNKLNWFLRDWRRDEPTRMDPHLFDVVWEVYRSVGAQSQIHVVSAYRSAGTNAMLRRRSRAVAQQSRHITGQAMDFYIPGASMTRVREAGMMLQRGGVGFYPGSANQFVHMDTGSVRHWPKVSRDYLARLFPDGRTVHIPADGRPLAGFDTALAMVRARGGSASRFYDSRADESATYEDNDSPGSVVRQRSNSMGLFAGLFGGGQQRQAPVRATAPAPAPVVAAPAPAVRAGEAAPGVPARQETATVAAAQQPAAGRPVQITPNAPRMLIAAAPIPTRAPPAAVRLRGNEDEESEEAVAMAAPLPAARPAIPGEAAPQSTAFAALAPGASGNRPTVLPETAPAPVQTAMAPVPAARPQVIGGSVVAAAVLPPIITTGDQRGRATEAPSAPAMALAFASPSRPVTLPNASANASAHGPQPRASAERRAAETAQRPAAPQTRTAARIPAAAPPLMVAPSTEGVRGRVVFVRQTAERAPSVATLTTPDPRQLRLIEQPTQMVANSFSASPTATVPTGRFAGQAVSSLPTLEFSRAEDGQRRASLR